MARRRRPLDPDERDLWARVAATARPLHPERPERPVTVEAPPAVRKPHGIPGPFRIGEMARRSPQGAVAALPAGPSAQPLRMDAKTYDRMTRGKLQPEARIDLHGMTLSEAHGELIRFLLGARRADLRLVLVITGKGRGMRDDGWPGPERSGALRHQVPHWLALPPLGPVVQQVAGASLKHGGAGAIYVFLRRR